jgi:hypothetical protein
MFRKGYYNYHKTKSEILALKIDFHLLECTICLKPFYTEIELPEHTTTSTDKDSSIFIDNDCYEMLMITPCKHVFHTECLESWVVVRLECPVCKQSLPYIE